MLSLKEVEDDDDGAVYQSNLRENALVVPGSALESLSQVQDDTESNMPQSPVKSLEMEQKYLYALETIRQLRHRLVRRTNVIDEIRKYYLRDIVTMKHVLNEVLEDSDRETAWKRYDERLPSLDLKDSLMIHAPGKTEFQVKPCEMCGGQLELISKDTDEVFHLKKLLRESKDREGRWREKLAYLDVQVETANKEKAEAMKSHMEEKRVLYAEMKKLKEEMDKLKTENANIARSNKKMKIQHEEFLAKNADLFNSSEKLVESEKEIDILKVNMEETQETLRQVRLNEKNMQKELVSTKVAMQDLVTTIDKGKYEIEHLTVERQQLSQQLQKLSDSHQDNETVLQQTTDSLMIVGKRVRELEEQMQASTLDYETRLSEANLLVDKIKHEMKMMQQKEKTHVEKESKLETALTVAHTEIQQLHQITKMQEQELLESAEEIEQIEEEVISMQQFIRENVGGMSSYGLDLEDDEGEEEDGDEDGDYDDDDDDDHDEDHDGDAHNGTNEGGDPGGKPMKSSQAAQEVEGNGLSPPSTMPSSPSQSTKRKVKKKSKKSQKSSPAAGSSSFRAELTGTAGELRKKRTERKQRNRMLLSSYSKDEVDDVERDPSLLIPSSAAAGELDPELFDVGGGVSVNEATGLKQQVRSPGGDRTTRHSHVHRLSKRQTSQSRLRTRATHTSAGPVAHTEALPMDTAAMVDLAQAERYSDVPNAKAMWKKAEIFRRKSVPNMFIFRSFEKVRPKGKKKTKKSKAQPIDKDQNPTVGNVDGQDPNNAEEEQEEEEEDTEGDEVEVAASSSENRADSNVQKRSEDQKARVRQMTKMFDRNPFQTIISGKNLPSKNHPSDQAQALKEMKEIMAVATQINKSFASKPAAEAEPPCELEAPPVDATSIELHLRKELYDALKATKHLKENACNRVLNVATPLIHSICQHLEHAVVALWNALQSSKRSMDFFQKMEMISEGIVSCGKKGTTPATIAETCAILVPVAGSVVSSNLSASWQQKLQVKEELILDLTPAIVNYETGERKVKAYNEYFFPFLPGSNALNANVNVLDFPLRLAAAEDTIKKVNDASQVLNVKMGEYLVEVLREWSSAKSVFIDLEARVEAEKEKVKRTLEAKLAAIGKELNRQQGINEKHADKIRGMERKLDEYARMEIQYKECEVQLENTKLSLTKANETIEEEQQKVEVQAHDIVTKRVEIQQLQTTVHNLEENVQHLQQEFAAEVHQHHLVDEQLAAMTVKKEDFEHKFEHMVDREDARLNRLSTQETQTRPDAADVEIQTEFLSTPMELKTILTNKLAKSGLKKYPMVFAQGLEYMNADQIDPSAAVDAASYVSENNLSRPGTSNSSARGDSRGDSRRGQRTLADIPLKDAPSMGPRFTIDDFFPPTDAKGLPNVNRTPLELLGSRILPVEHPNSLPYINAMTTGVLSRRLNSEPMQLAVNLNPVPPSPHIAADQQTTMDFVQRMEQLPSRQQSFEELARIHSNAGLSKIAIAGPIQIQSFNEPSSNTPRSVHSMDSTGTGTSSKGLKKGTNARYHTKHRESSMPYHDPSVEQPAEQFFPVVQSYHSPSKMRLVTSSASGDDEFEDDRSLSPTAAEYALASAEIRNANALRNQASNEYQEVVNGIVYNHKRVADHISFRTEATKMAEKEQEIALLREPMTIKSFGSHKYGDTATHQAKLNAQRPKDSQSPVTKSMRVRISDDSGLTGTTNSNGSRLLSSSLSQAGLSSLNSDSVKRLQKELLR